MNLLIVLASVGTILFIIDKLVEMDMKADPRRGLMKEMQGSLERKIALNARIAEINQRKPSSVSNDEIMDIMVEVNDTSYDADVILARIDQIKK